MARALSAEAFSGAARLALLAPGYVLHAGKLTVGHVCGSWPRDTRQKLSDLETQQVESVSQSALADIGCR